MPGAPPIRTDVFLDTNVLLYRAASGDDFRCEIADAILANGGVVSVHVLSEFTNVMRSRRWNRPWDEVKAQLDVVRANTYVLPVTIDTHTRALRYAERYRLQYFDALHVSSAVMANCTTLFSEDMHDGLVIDGLTVRNPFRGF
jgi:predicted nucleic acid-binding protein